LYGCVLLGSINAQQRAERTVKHPNSREGEKDRTKK
jgi:hypothetical protein